MIIGLMLGMLGCSKSKTASVLDDIARDTYENSMRKQRIDDMGKPTYQEPLTYDQCKRERNNTNQKDKNW